MSYILDALRRSQAERERGQVPGLNARPAVADVATEPQRRAPRWLLPAAAVAGLTAALALAWLWRSPDRAAPAVAVSAATPAPAAASASTRPAPLPVVVSAPPVAPPATPPAAAPRVAAAPRGETAAPVLAAPPASAVPAPAADGRPPPPAARPLTLAQLSAEQRREFPQLVVGGSIWSENKASRFVILNGQIVREGETVAPGLTLESLSPKAAVLRWRDLRIELPL